MTDLIANNPNVFAIAAIVVYAVENILPYTPIKANSTVQLAIDVLKTLFKKK